MIVAEILAVSLIIAVASMVFAGILAVVPAVCGMIVAEIFAVFLVPAVASKIVAGDLCCCSIVLAVASCQQGPFVYM